MKTEAASPGALSSGSSEPSSRSPLVSVIVPAHNPGTWLDRCLAALNASDWPCFEIIVVDDASTEPGIDAVAQRHGATCLRLERNVGPALARNRGASMAAGELLMTVDADVLVHPDTMRKGAEVLAGNPGVAAVFGSYDEQPEHRSFLSQYRNLYHRWVHQQGEEEAGTYWAGCGLVRKDAFEAVGGFSRLFAKPSIEDIELGYRLRDAGWRIRLRKDMQCSHLKQWTLGNLVRTDIFQRGMPWLALMLHRGQPETGLNAGPRARVATVAAALMPAALIGAAWWPPLLWALLPLTGVIVAMQWGFYRETATLKGLGFALRVVPAQILFFLCCAAAVPLGYGQYLRSRRDQKLGSG